MHLQVSSLTLSGAGGTFSTHGYHSQLASALGTADSQGAPPDMPCLVVGSKDWQKDSVPSHSGNQATSENYTYSFY